MKNIRVFHKICKGDFIMEEIRNENVNDIEEIEEIETEGSGMVGAAAAIIGAVVAVGAGIGALIYKNRDKIDERRINILRKKGYTVYKDENVVEVEFEDSDEEDDK